MITKTIRGIIVGTIKQDKLKKEGEPSKKDEKKEEEKKKKD